MRKFTMLAAVLVAFAMPVAASAQVSLGLRLGYGFAMGEVQKDADLADFTSGQIPVQLDAMWRFSPNLSAGAYFSYGFGQLGDALDACDLSGVDCSASDLRLGAQAAFTFAQPAAKLAPWLGAGLGWEWNKLTADTSEGDASVTISGLEATLQGGADYRVSPKFSVGPFASISFGRYSDLSSDGGFEEELDEESVHQWLQLGIRGTFDL